MILVIIRHHGRTWTGCSRRLNTVADIQFRVALQLPLERAVTLRQNALQFPLHCLLRSHLFDLASRLSKVAFCCVSTSSSRKVKVVVVLWWYCGFTRIAVLLR